jgi:hypothetical protein
MIVHYVGGSQAGQTEDLAVEAIPADGLIYVGADLEQYRPADPQRLVSTALGDATVLVLDSDRDAK